MAMTSSKTPAPFIGPEALRARVLHRDSDLIVIDKPAGLAVHAGPSTTVHLEMMLEALTFGVRHAPRLVHRLDRDTSGCLVLARHEKAVRKLGRLFTAGAVEKTYWAVVSGTPPESEGRIELALRKVSNKAGWRMVVARDGQAAVTEYRVLGTAGGRSWLELRPRTGRTHQIRVHCAAIGCPVIGDPRYGPSAGAGGAILHLHARSVVVPYSTTKPPVTAVANPPSHMAAFLRVSGYT